MGANEKVKKEKMANIVREMKKHSLNILGLSEVKWKKSGDCYFEGYRFISVGGGRGEHGVAIILDQEMARRVVNIEQEHGDRLIKIEIEAKPRNLMIVQVYMPTTDSDDEEIEQMYEKIEKLIKSEKSNEHLIVMGDWNAVVGEEESGSVIGKYGIGRKNERGERLIEFCKKNQLVATNTCFQQPKRRRYTWKSPGDRYRNQLDYILTRTRYRNSVNNSLSYPGADIGSDHNLVVMTVDDIRLKKIKRGKKKRKLNLQKLKENPDQFKNNIESKLESMKTQETGLKSSNERWKELKDILYKGAVESLGFKSHNRIRKPWITEEMVSKMEERRQAKKVNTEDGRKKYRRLNNELRRITDEAYENWWKEECASLELLERQGRIDLLYARIKEITEEKKARNICKQIKNREGELLKDPEEIKKRWKEYIEDLYDKDGKPILEQFNLEEEENVGIDERGPELIDTEILAAIDELKSGKAEGCDGIPAELLKALGEKGKKCLVEVCKSIYETGKWPDDFTKAIIVTIEKKMNASECADHRTINLIAHASKIMLRLLGKRLENKAKYFIGKTQFGFRKGCGTREAISVMRLLCERRLEFDEELFVCFVDFEKAFDRVKWTKLFEVLKKIGVDWRDRRLIMNLYMQQTAVVRTENGDSEPGEIGRGVRQGCLLSPLLFSIYAEMMMIEAMEDVEEGVRVGGELLKDVKFADDQGMVAQTEKGLQTIMDALSKTGKEYDMKINVKKTKVMRVCRNGSKREGSNSINILIEGQLVEQVNQFRYLGSLISDDGTCTAEIKSRIAMAKNAFNKRRELFSKRLSKELKKRVIMTIVWSVALYGSETWTLRKYERDRLEAFEMWTWRNMENISWKDHITNEYVLGQVNEKRKLLNIILERKKRWLGHILRGESLVKEVIEGRMEGKRGRGKPRIMMLDDIKADETYEKIKRRAMDRECWRNWMPRTCFQAEHQ